MTAWMTVLHSCRHTDSARYYQNEAEVGKAVRESGIPRDDIFVTTKIWLSDFGYKSAKKVRQPWHPAALYRTTNSGSILQANLRTPSDW